MNVKLLIRAVTIAGLLVSAAPWMVAGTPIRLSFRDTTIASGNPLSYAIYVDSSLSGYSVRSYQIQFTYNTTYFKFVGASASGTIDSTWGAPTVKEITPGTVNIASAGSDTLLGPGKLVVLNFTSTLFTGYYSNSGYFSFVSGSGTLFNEGFPTMAFRNGTVTLTPGPSITITPNTSLLTKGDVVQFGVSGGHIPYTWTSTNPSVASVDASGKLTGVSAGFLKLIAADSNGYVDTSGSIEVRAFKLSLRDTSCFQGQTIDVPVYSTNLTGLGILAGQTSFTFDASRWTFLGSVEKSTIVDSTSNPTWSVAGGTASVSFARSSSLGGSGILFYLRFKASTSNSGGTSLAVQSAFMNETMVGNVGTSYLTNQALGAVTVTPGYAQSLVLGDSVQFQASGGVPPYSWSVAGSGRATVSTTGWLRGYRSGMDTVKAKDSLGSIGVSGPVSMYDFRLSVPDTSLIPNSSVDVPVYVSANDTGFSSFQLSLTYSPSSTYVVLDSLVTAGTLSSGMTPAVAFHNGSATLAFAGTSKVFGSGMLVKLRFLVPDSTPRPSTTYITITSALFNEGIPLALVKNGSFQIANRANFSIAPASAALHTVVGSKDSALFTVYNTGTANLTSTVGVVGSSVFTVSVSNINVLPGDSAKITVYYRPTLAGPSSANIQFGTNDPYHATVSVPVTGATPYPILSFSVPGINFGLVAVGQYKDTTLTISNTGTDTLRITGIAGTVGAFTARPTAATLAPGQTVVDTVRFKPVTGGPISAKLSVTSNSLTSPDTIGLSGSGSTVFPVLTLSRSTVSFGGVLISSFKDTTVTITNNGTDTLKISGMASSNGVFSARPVTRTVPPGQSFPDTLRFSPTLAGGYSGRIFITSNAPTSPDTIVVSGTGNTPTDVSGSSTTPDNYVLNQNYPNPFNPSTIIGYGLKAKSRVRLEVFNVLGQKVDELVNAEQNEGYHSVTWHAMVPSGVYFYRIDATSSTDATQRFTQIRKMVFMK